MLERHMQANALRYGQVFIPPFSSLRSRPNNRCLLHTNVFQTLSLSSSRPPTATMARKKTEESIPRPANCFLQFLSDKVKDCRNRGNWNNRCMAVFTKEVSNMWKEAPQWERDMYIAKALTAKEEHKKRYPGYRYRPRKRGTKTAVAKTGDANSPYTSGSPSSSSTSSSASTPAPTTPVTIMPAAGSSTVGNAFGGGLNLNHRPVPMLLEYVVSHLRPLVPY